MKKLVPVVLVVLLAAACGGGSSDGDGDSNGDLEVSLEDFGFNPDAATVTAGSDVSVSVTNIGGIQHSWVLLDQSEAPASASEIDESAIIADSGVVEAGSSATVDFVVDLPGTYAVVCTVAGHIEAGMVGTLEVSADAAGS